MVLNSKKFISLIMIFSLIFISVLAPVAKASESDKTKFLKEAIEIVPEKTDKKIQTTSETGFVEDFITGDINLNTTKTKTVKPSEVEDYKIYKGQTQIDIVEFTRLTESDHSARKLEEEIEKRTSPNGIGMLVSVTATVGGFFLMSRSEGLMGDLGAAATGGGIGGFFVSLTPSGYSNTDFISYQEALKRAQIYNSELRNELGLSK